MAQETPTSWSANPSAEADEYTYDSATATYDSAQQDYDGVDPNNLNDTEKVPTAWSSL